MSNASRTESAPMDPRRRRQMRVSIGILTGIVLALYFGFILMSVLKAHH